MERGRLGAGIPYSRSYNKRHREAANSPPLSFHASIEVTSRHSVSKFKIDIDNFLAIWNFKSPEIYQYPSCAWHDGLLSGLLSKGNELTAPLRRLDLDSNYLGCPSYSDATEPRERVDFERSVSLDLNLDIHIALADVSFLFKFCTGRILTDHLG